MIDEDTPQATDEEALVMIEVYRLAELKRHKAEIEQEIADIEKYLDKTVENSVSFTEEDGTKTTATVVRGTVDRFDEHLISTRYKRIWNSITKRTVDKKLYLDAVKTGQITPEMHAKFHATVEKKPYVKITRVRQESE